MKNEWNWYLHHRNNNTALFSCFTEEEKSINGAELIRKLILLLF